MDSAVMLKLLGPKEQPARRREFGKSNPDKRWGSAEARRHD